jgi:hypothetical protein
MNENLTDENFLIFCAKHYDNPHCASTSEFIEDLKHIRYVKKLLTRYIEKGDLKERLILNHLTILCNLFGSEPLCRILYLKLKNQFHCVKPFLILLNILPEKIYNVGNEKVIITDLIPIDSVIVESLRKIKNA